MTPIKFSDKRDAETSQPRKKLMKRRPWKAAKGHVDTESKQHSADLLQKLRTPQVTVYFSSPEDLEIFREIVALSESHAISRSGVVLEMLHGWAEYEEGEH